MNMKPSPQKKPDSITAMRGTTLGQMHQGELKTHLSHPFITFFLRLAGVLNTLSFCILWILFTIMNLFPPYTTSFKWAIGAYFVFGMMYTVFAYFFFKFAKVVENQAVSQAMTHNRRYEWHTQYDTKNMTEEDLKKVPTANKQMTADQAIGAGVNYFRITVFLGMASVISWFLGVWAFFDGFLADGG